MGLEFEPQEDFELALAFTPGIGSGTIGRILARNAITGVSNTAFLSLSNESLREEYRLSARSANYLTKPSRKLAEDILKYKARAAGKPRGEGTHQSRISLDEAPNIVAIAAIPFRPAVTREMADLIQPGGVPCLSDQFRIRKLLVEFDLPNNGRMLQWITVFTARQNGPLVKAEPVERETANRLEIDSFDIHTTHGNEIPFD